MSLPALARKLHVSSSVIAVYGVTLFALWQGLQPLFLSSHPVVVDSSASIYLPAEPVVVPPKEVIRGIPVAISIPSLSMDREIIPGSYDEQARSWHISVRGIHFANLSRPANDHSGNTLIYAHNNRYAFGPLKRLQAGDSAHITTDNGYLFTYRLARSSGHSPDDTAIFAYNGAPLLTLMTCSGAFNEIRTFYTFTLEEVEKP